MRYAPFNCAKFSLFSALSQSRNPAVVCQMASIKTKGQQARQYGLLSRHCHIMLWTLSKIPGYPTPEIVSLLITAAP